MPIDFLKAYAYDIFIRGGMHMLNFDEEIKKFKPCLEVEDIEEAIYQEDLTDMADILKEYVKKN